MTESLYSRSISPLLFRCTINLRHDLRQYLTREDIDLRLWRLARGTWPEMGAVTNVIDR